MNGLIALFAFVMLTTVLSLTLSPEQYELTVGSVAGKTIAATKDVIDIYTTEQNREKAAAAVQPTYSENTGSKLIAQNNLDSLFASLEDARATGEALRTGGGKYGVETPEHPKVTMAPDGVITRETYNEMSGRIENLPLSVWQMTILMNLDERSLAEIKNQTQSALALAMEGTIVEGQLDGVVNNIQRQLLINMSTDLCYNIAMPVVRASIVPTMVINQDATQIERDKARSEVEPVYYKQGQNIVTAGTRVTEQQIELLQSLGLIAGNRYDKILFGGVAALIALTLIVFAIHMNIFEQSVMGTPKLLLLMLVISLITITLSYILQTVSPYLAPIAVGALLAIATLPLNAALSFNVLLCIILGFVSPTNGISQQMLHTTIHGILGGSVGIFVLSRHHRRITMLVAGIYVALFNMASMFAVGFITNSSMQSILNDALFSLGGGFLSAVLAIGLQPALEWTFNLVTPAKLMELSNPNHPLLRRLMLETPGTYQHSLMVANLAEAASIAIGANSLLSRVGAYYHDIGKLSRPQFFKENQLGNNPHDELEPEVSAKIIISHVSDGLALAAKHHLPQVIRDHIAQHHGDTPVVYFYKEACAKSADNTCDIANFRYVQPRPSTAETAILMLADSVEAAIRSIPDPSYEKIEKTIAAIVQQKMSDGQLDDAPLNFRDLNTICKSFTSALNGLYHQRIEYPKIDMNVEAKAHAVSPLSIGRNNAPRDDAALPQKAGS